MLRLRTRFPNPSRLRVAGAALLLWGAALLGGPAAAQITPSEDYLYTVQPGDNAWALTERLLIDLSYWQRLVTYNRLVDDRRLQPGTVLRVPTPWLKLVSARVRLTRLQGAVEIDSGRGWEAAASGAELLPDQRVRTAAGSSAVLSLADGVSVDLAELSELRVRRVGQNPADGRWRIHLDLLRGRLESQAHELRRRGGQFDVQTPAAVTSVRGTSFRVTVEDGRTRTEVVDGAVELANTQGRTMLPQATGTRVEAQRPPEPARPLLPAPDLNALTWNDTPRAHEAGRPAVHGASGFRTRVRTLAQPVITIHEQVGPTVAWPVLAEGDYRVAVRAIDPIGLEGLEAERPLAVRPEPAPTRPRPFVPSWLPADENGHLVLRWTAPPAATGRVLYQVQVMRIDAPAPAIVLDEFALRPQLELPWPEPGRYEVRVRRAPEVGDDPPWSEPRPLIGRDPARPSWWQRLRPEAAS